jgi:GT2 family glycosyltransferase/MoaA/NifB/PqqE/SkfB family radical SAM enzyme
MPFELFERIIAELRDPDIIRLNYSGESILYPQIGRAVKLAKAAGALVELVTALAPARRGVVEELVDAGLDRLTISLHTLDATQFRAIYGLDLLSNLEHRIADLVAHKKRIGAINPEIDFSFVAMDGNLGQLDAVVACADRIASTAVYVHPVIRRDLIPVSLVTELDSGGNLRSSFASRIRERVKEVQPKYPGVGIVVARPGVMDTARCPAEIAQIPSCEQNPWETMHILSNGDVVACEVLDKVSLGNLNSAGLGALWTGERYRDFRERYRASTVAECNVCPWRKGTSGKPARDRALPGVEFVWGWHEQVNENIRWSRRSSLLTMHASKESKRMLIRGVLPPAGREAVNRLTVVQDGVPVHTFENAQREVTEIKIPIAIRHESSDIELTTSIAYCPAIEGSGTDRRYLGFGWIEARIADEPWSTPQPPARAISRHRDRARLWLRTVTAGDRIPALRQSFARLAGVEYSGSPGVSVIIPERDDPKHLAICLDALEAAAANINEGVQVIVVVNGSEWDAYQSLMRQFCKCSFYFFDHPLGFSRAIEAGLKHALSTWTYLLNSDVVLHPQALARVLELRQPDVFGIASRIFMRDRSQPSLETNWTQFVFADGLIEALERIPAENDSVEETAYAGGGCSLFQTRLLTRLVRRTRSYDPFYWEDIEWGAVARRNGYVNLFCPTSHAWHERRSTIGRFYAPSEVERITERNRLLFNVRNAPDAADPRSLRFQVESLPARTISELMRPALIAETIRARWNAIRGAIADRELFGTKA